MHWRGSKGVMFFQKKWTERKSLKISFGQASELSFPSDRELLEEIVELKRSRLFAFENCLGGLRHGRSKILCMGGELVALVSSNRQGRPYKLARNRQLRIAKNRRAVLWRRMQSAPRPATPIAVAPAARQSRCRRRRPIALAETGNRR